MSEVPISTIAEINPPVRLPAGVAGEDLVSFIPMADVSDSGQWTHKQARKLCVVRAGFTSFEEGDVLLAKITPCLENGKGAHAVGLQRGVGFGTTEFHVLRAKPGHEARFVFHVTQSRRFRHAAEGQMVGSAGQKRVPRKFFDEFRVINVDRVEEARIAQILDTLDTAIHETAAIVTKLKVVKQGMLHDLLTLGIDAKGELRGARPSSIPLQPLSRLAHINPKTVVSLPQNADVSFVPMVATNESGEIVNAELRRWGAVASGMTLFEDGDVLVAKITPCFQNGKGGLARNLCNSVGFGSTEFHVLRSKPNCHPSFLHYWTITPQFRSQGERYMTGTAGQRRVTAEFFDNFLVPVFSFEEQLEIVRILDAQNRSIELESSTLQKLKEQRVGLEDDLLAGRVRVTPLLPDALQEEGGA
jgi:type I restriction enzyme S subunit